jgi:hypothetical protein
VFVIGSGQLDGHDRRRTALTSGRGGKHLGSSLPGRLAKGAVYKAGEDSTETGTKPSGVPSDKMGAFAGHQ